MAKQNYTQLAKLLNIPTFEIEIDNVKKRLKMEIGSTLLFRRSNNVEITRCQSHQTYFIVKSTLSGNVVSEIDVI